MSLRDQTRTADAKPVPPVRDEILWFVETTFASWNWAHKSLKAALRDLTVPEAGWRMGPYTHSVWEQINHVAHWKQWILLRLRGESPQSKQAWPAGGRTAAQLRRSIEALGRLHEDLRAAILKINPPMFAVSRRGKYSLAQLLMGSTAHDCYHIGQILLTRKLYRSTRRGTPQPARPSGQAERTRRPLRKKRTSAGRSVT